MPYKAVGKKVYIKHGDKWSLKADTKDSRMAQRLVKHLYSTEKKGK